MTHEFRDLIDQAYAWRNAGHKVVMASVVRLEGSSYRRPGVRMLICDTGKMKGAVSGGCVEKEVLRQAKSVFETDKPKMMTYDGRFRLGCEGLLYILIEPVTISEVLYNSLQQQLNKRSSFSARSYFSSEGDDPGMGTIVQLGDLQFTIDPKISQPRSENLSCFEQEFPPVFQLYIFGAEHDAVQLSSTASSLGWDVHIVAAADEEKDLSYFHGARKLHNPLAPESADVSGIDDNTAVILMSHSFQKDLRYLFGLKESKPAYLGILGPARRRERVFSEFLEHYPETSPEFFERIHGPAGIHIGAESASEIAVSIVAEILSVIRNTEILPLREKTGSIHE